MQFHKENNKEKRALTYDKHNDTLIYIIPSSTVYTVFNKKRNHLFSTITLAFLVDFYSASAFLQC